MNHKTGGGPAQFSAAEVYQHLQRESGPCPPEAEFGWLAGALDVSGIAPSSGDAWAYFANIYMIVARAWRQTGERDATIVELACRLGAPNGVRTDREGLMPDLADQATRQRFFGLCRDHGVDFNCGFQRLAATRHEAALEAEILFEQGLLDPAEILDIEGLISGAAPPAPSPEGGVAEDPRSMHFWMRAHPAAVTAAIIPRLERATDDEAFLLAKAATVAVDNAVIRPAHSAAATDLLRRVAGVLERRLGDAPHHAPGSLRRVCIELWGRLLLDQRGHHRPAEQVRGAASYELARLRQVLSRAGDPGAAQEFEDASPLFQASVTVMFETGCLWKAVRPLLLAIRALGAPAVAPDLRYWRSRMASAGGSSDVGSSSRQPYGVPNPAKQHPPEPWVQIPETLASCFHFYVQREQQDDPELAAFRKEFARYCLDHLASTDGDSSPKEANWRWRVGYIRAAAELRVNPRGRGHRILHYAAESDPNDRVRAVARAAYGAMRHEPVLGDMSPRRAVFRAVAQLLRAHLEALGQRVNEDEAKSTVEHMVRRTTLPAEELSPERLYP